MQHELLHTPIQQLTDKQHVLRWTRDLMHPSERAGPVPRFAERAENVAIQIELIELPDARVRCIQHLLRSRCDAHRPRRADIGKRLQKFAVGVEYLNAVVLAVTDVEAVLMSMAIECTV